jgi:hypothetical protein
MEQIRTVQDMYLTINLLLREGSEALGGSPAVWTQSHANYKVWLVSRRRRIPDLALYKLLPNRDGRGNMPLSNGSADSLQSIPQH